VIWSSFTEWDLVAMEEQLEKDKGVKDRAAAAHTQYLKELQTHR
jgi:hypothetical protein